MLSTRRSRVLAVAVLAVAMTLSPHAAARALPRPEAPIRTAENQVNVGSIPLTIAPGWRIGKQDDKWVGITYEAKEAAFSLEEFTFERGITIEEATGRFYQDSVVEQLSNAQHAPAYDPKFTGARFQESEAVEYTGDLQTDKGTTRISGVLVVLLNPKTGYSGLAKLVASDPDVLQEVIPDAAAMIESTLNLRG